jgi:hypothetical protein
MSGSTGAKPFVPFGKAGKFSGRREHGTPDQEDPANRRLFQGKCRQKAVRSAPGRDRAEAGVIGIIGVKARVRDARACQVRVISRLSVSCGRINNIATSQNPVRACWRGVSRRGGAGHRHTDIHSQQRAHNNRERAPPTWRATRNVLAAPERPKKQSAP